MKKIFFTLIKIYAGTIFGQTYNVTPQQITVMPTQVSETSGIEINPADTNKIWTHNDSGDSAYVYQVNTQGQLLRKIKIGTGKAVDIEDIARDDAGNYYIADVGNNTNNRTNLIIRKVGNLDTLTGNTIGNDKIFLSYPDQLLFPPPAAEQNFDCESVFFFNNNLYLFSKNRGTSGYCKMYSVPDSAGTYIATLHDSINTGTNVGSWITSADISPDNSKIALLSEMTLHIFSNFTSNNFFGGTHIYYNFSSYTQKEGVVFLNNDEVYITDEKNSFLNNGGNLYKLNITNVLTQNKWLSQANIITYPNPTTDLLYVAINHTLTQPLQLSVHNALGKQVLTKTYTNNAIDYITLPVANLVAGLYTLHLTHQNVSSVIRFVKE